MRHKTTETVFNYFNTLRAGRSAPLRTEIDPAALKSVLPDLFIMEKGRDGIIRFRLAGTRVCAMLGQEMRDRTFSDIWDPAVRHRMRLAADTVLANRKALEIAVTAVDADGIALSLEMLMLPLFSRAGQCDRIFGSLVALDTRFPVEGYTRHLAPADLIFAATDEARPGSGGAAPNRAPAPSLGTVFNRAPHLRVLEGGRRD